MVKIHSSNVPGQEMRTSSTGSVGTMNSTGRVGNRTIRDRQSNILLASPSRPASSMRSSLDQTQWTTTAICPYITPSSTMMSRRYRKSSQKPRSTSSSETISMRPFSIFVQSTTPRMSLRQCLEEWSSFLNCSRKTTLGTRPSTLLQSQAA